MEKIIILDFGSQTTQLIARRLRELNEYCEIVPYNKFPEQTNNIKGVILSGSPFSVYDPSAFKTDLSNIRGVFPVLGICYGAQFMAYTSQFHSCKPCMSDFKKHIQFIIKNNLRPCNN